LLHNFKHPYINHFVSHGYNINYNSPFDPQKIWPFKMSKSMQQNFFKQQNVNFSLHTFRHLNIEYKRPSFTVLDQFKYNCLFNVNNA